MSKIKKKLISIIVIAIMLAVMPIVTFATNEKIQIVKIDEEEYILYVEGMEKTDFKYAVSNNPEENEIDLNFINAVDDDDGNKVVLIDNTTYNALKNKTIYLWIKQQDKNIISAEEVDFTKAFEKSKMIEIEMTTKKIGAEIVENLQEEDRVDENGVHITVAVGGVKITDKENAIYSYQIVSATGEYGTLMELAKEIQSEYNNMNMFTKIKTANEFYSLYQKLLDSAQWTDVQDMMIRQPKEAKENEEYVIFIKKVENQNITYDVQFLTCHEVQTPTYEKEKIITQQTSRLPITADNIVLIIVLAVIIVALIFVAIRVKKLNDKTGKND